MIKIIIITLCFGFVCIPLAWFMLPKFLEQPKYNVIKKEREGKYLGKTVQVVPHITNEIVECIESVSNKSEADFCLIELASSSVNSE